MNMNIRDMDTNMNPWIYEYIDENIKWLVTAAKSAASIIA